GFSAAGGPASLLAPSLGGRPKAADPSPGAGGASVARPSIAAPAPFAGASLANVLAALPVLAGELVPPSPQPHTQADKPTRTRYRPQSRMTGSFPSALKKGCRGQVSRGITLNPCPGSGRAAAPAAGRPWPAAGRPASRRRRRGCNTPGRTAGRGESPP